MTISNESQHRITPSDGDVVRELLRAGNERDWAHVLELMAEDSVTYSSTGRIYLGHDGVSKWLQDTTVSTTTRRFEAVTVRDLGDGFVLVVGTDHRDPRSGAPEAVPGAWIYHVRDARVKACIYFRTEREAVRSLSGPGRDEPAIEFVDRLVDAFNRDDFGAMVSMLGDNVRFVSSLVDSGVEKEGTREFLEYLVAMRARFDDVLLEEIEVEELEGGWTLTDARRRVVDDEEVEHQHVFFLIRIVNGRMVEWRPVADPEAARAEVARSLAAVEDKA